MVYQKIDEEVDKAEKVVESGGVRRKRIFRSTLELA